jgi:molecular chaperone GrpE (heat shock protein)
MTETDAMFDFLRRWFRKRRPTPAEDERLLALERDVQTLRLELEERDRQIAALRAELEQEQRAVTSRIEEAVREAMEQLLADAAVPAAQLLTQAHLAEREGRPPAPRDILLVARRLVRVLEDHGLEWEGRVGELVAFDPNRHQLLGAETVPPGQRVVVRFPGAVFHGKMLRKAGVERAEE